MVVSKSKTYPNASLKAKARKAFKPIGLFKYVLLY